MSDQTPHRAVPDRDNPRDNYECAADGEPWPCAAVRDDEIVAMAARLFVAHGHPGEFCTADCPTDAVDACICGSGYRCDHPSHDRRRRRAVRLSVHWLRCQWGRTGYRPTMRLLHRLNLCWMEPLPLRDGDNGEWINVWCHWCGVRGSRLDMTRVVMPSRTDSESPASPVATSAPNRPESP